MALLFYAGNQSSVAELNAVGQPTGGYTFSLPQGLQFQGQLHGERPGGGHYLAGWLYAPPPGPPYFSAQVVIATGPTLQTSWVKELPSNINDVAVAQDGSAFVSMTTGSVATVVKLSSTGTVIWATTLSLPGLGTRLTATPDGGIAVTAWGGWSLPCAKLNGAGATVFSRVIDTGNTSNVVAAPAASGGLLLAAKLEGPTNFGLATFLVDSAGALTASKFYPGELLTNIHALAVFEGPPIGTHLLTGSRSGALWWALVDASGAIGASAMIPGGSNDQVYDAVGRADGSWLIASSTGSSTLVTAIGPSGAICPAAQTFSLTASPLAMTTSQGPTANSATVTATSHSLQSVSPSGAPGAFVCGG